MEQVQSITRHCVKLQPKDPYPFCEIKTVKGRQCRHIATQAAEGVLYCDVHRSKSIKEKFLPADSFQPYQVICAACGFKEGEAPPAYKLFHSWPCPVCAERERDQEMLTAIAEDGCRLRVQSYKRPQDNWNDGTPFLEMLWPDGEWRELCFFGDMGYRSFSPEIAVKLLSIASHILIDQ